MDQPTTATTLNNIEEEEQDSEWELLNLDGFVFKRNKKKRRRIADSPDQPESSATAAPASEVLQVDSSENERRRREAKKKKLLKLKDKYQREIDGWEHLSNTLRAMEEKARDLHERSVEGTTTTATTPCGENAVEERESTCGSSVDELIKQAEAHEEIIHDISSLCDVAEATCSAQEEQVKRSLLDLPIWDSPRSLMSRLCDE